MYFSYDNPIFGHVHISSPSLLSKWRRNASLSYQRIFKMKKISALLILFTFLTFSSAHAIVCSFTEDEGSRREKTTDILLVTDNYHGMTQFNLDMAEGFIAASNGYLVLNIILKENGQVFSLNTMMTENTVLGGTILTPDRSRLMRISCK